MIQAFQFMYSGGLIGTTRASDSCIVCEYTGVADSEASAGDALSGAELTKPGLLITNQ